MATDPRFLASSGRAVFIGNEALVKGALETEGGVGLMTGYPGSPVAGFFDVLGDLKDLLKSHGVRAYQANNEALGVASANGSQMAPIKSIVTMKSVGVHVASDALALGTLAGSHPQGGVVVISGEDPWCESTQVPADSRFLFEHLRMPVVEPGTLQELKDWINLSFKLSQAAGLYIGYIVTVAHADGGGTVECYPNQFPTLNTKDKITIDTASIPLEKMVLLPPRTWRKELQTDERYRITMDRAREIGINRIYPATRACPFSGKPGDAPAPIGFITTGMGRPYLEHVLFELGLAGMFPILNMGMSYPADAPLVAEFSKLCKTMIVIEERRSFLEKNIRDAAFKQLSHEDARDVVSRLFGKKFPGNVDGIPDTRGLNYSVLAQKLIPLIKSTDEIPAEQRNGRLTAEMQRLREASKPKLQVITDKIVSRTPTFCPGCPHRDSSSVLLEVRKNFADPEYMKRVHNRAPVDMVAHGDTGCYTMLMFAPTEQLMHNYSGMGLGGATGSGIDPFITNKQIVFMGDGTFFHSGQLAISNSIKAAQDITYIILENGTTAMTGHQEHAGLADDLLGNKHYIQDIEKIVRGMAAHSPIKILKMTPEDREGYKKALEETILSDGVKIIIADKECGITHNRTVMRAERKTIKEKGYLPEKTHMNITPEVCEDCRECTKATACPGLTVVDTDYGKKIDTDLTWCVNDGACERVRTSNDYGTSVKPCPSFEQIKIVRSKRKRYSLPNMHLDRLPEPKAIHDMRAGSTWRCHLAGVGGMGIGVVGAILVRAGHKEGYRVLFQDKKGLAIRTGGVYSQMTFVKDAGPERSEGPDGPQVTGSIPYGKADLLLGVDILEAARATDPREQFRVAHKGYTTAVLNLHKQPTVYALLGRDDFSPEELRDEVFEHCKVEHSFAKDLSKICEERLGSKLYVNIMMVGVAYQLGLIPVSAHSIAWAIKDSISREHRKNLKAFNIGRKIALEPRALPIKPEPETWQQLVTNKSRILRKTKLRGRKWGEDFERLVDTAMKVMRDLSDAQKYDLAIRLYDLMQYQDFHYAKRYMDLVRGVYKRDSGSEGAAEKKLAVTHAVIWNLAKVMLIKDEPYVAYLLTRYEKKVRDIAKYNVDESNGDRIVYRHHTSPEFNLGKWRVRFKMTTSDWQLNLVRKMKWWRKLPGWHKREVAFCDWYIGLLDRVSLAANGYEQALRVLKSPEQVSGYREVRYPKMDATRQSVEAELGAGLPKVELNVRKNVLDAFRTPAGV